MKTMNETFKKLKAEFDKILPDLMEKDSQGNVIPVLPDTVKDSIEHFIFHTYTKELLEAVKNKLPKEKEQDPFVCGKIGSVQMRDFLADGYNCCLHDVSSLLDATITSNEEKEWKKEIM